MKVGSVSDADRAHRGCTAAGSERLSTGDRLIGSDLLASLRRVVDPRLIAFGEAVDGGLRCSRGGVFADQFVFALVVGLALLLGFAAHLFKRVLVFRQSCFLRVNGASKKEVATISPESQRGVAKTRASTLV